MKIRVKTNAIEIKKETVQQINGTRSLFFERINKIDNPLASMLKKKKGKDPNK